MANPNRITYSFGDNAGLKLPIYRDDPIGADPVSRARSESSNQRERIGSSPQQRAGGDPSYRPGYGISSSQNRSEGLTPQPIWNQQFGQQIQGPPTPQGQNGSASLPIYSDSQAWMGHEGVANPPPPTVESNVLEKPSAYDQNGMRTERSAESGVNVQAYNPNHDAMNDNFQSPAALAIAGNGASRAFFVPQKYGGGVGSATNVPDGRTNTTPPNPIQRPQNTTDKKPGITPAVDYSVSGRLNPYV